ncbi:MaoC family dehydratase [Sphingobacterium multivorum]|nr:MaoC family dehydratase [Sphingobacterium multivorum]QQT33054.1 MaoC family dehydratase [Sphingobacterium multivorum]
MKPQLNDTFEYDFSFSREQVLKYAELSGDTNPVHVTETYGNDSIFGKCIVHGYFSISIFSKVYGTMLYPDGHILISQSAKYIKPVFADVEYTAVFTVIELQLDKNRVRYCNEIIDKRTGELKVTGEAILMNQKYYQL